MRRRLLATSALGVALAVAGCTTAQQTQVTATTAQVIAYLQQSETALETLITITVPAASQAAVQTAFADFTTAAQSVGAAIASAAPMTSVATGVQVVVKAYDAVEADLSPLLPANAQVVLAGVTITINLLASFAQSVLGTPVAAARYRASARKLISVVP